ncbi:MAG: HAD family phosphatase [Clostridiaceae bacterium]|nr:HAD family phosphatase [Clostridiaceae bacterium]
MPVWETITGRYLATQGIFTETDCNAFVATKTMTGGAEYLRTHFPLEKTTEQIVNEIVALILKAYQEEIPAKPGAAELLQALQKAGVKVTVATASARELVTPAFERTGLSKYIDGVFTCPEVGIGKEESPAVYDRAREFMGTDRAHSLVFEDSLHGIRTAKKAGYLTAGIHDPSSEKEQDAIRGLVDLYLESLEDARYIV